MAELFKSTEKERKAETDWLNRFKDSFERASRNIDKYHERKLLTFQVVALALGGAFLINLLTSAIYDLATSIFSQITTQRVIIDTFIGLISSALLIVIFYSLNKQFQKYEPPKPSLSFVIEPEDIKPFVNPSDFQQVIKCLENGELNDFELFGNEFFTSLHNWFAHIFHEKVDNKPKKEYEENKTPLKKFPTMIKEYDLSAMSLSGVNFALKIILVPHPIMSAKTASYGFHLIFKFRVLNPGHCNANDFLYEYYHLRASGIVRYSSYCIISAFRKIGCIKLQRD